MTITAAIDMGLNSIFQDDEAVIQSHPLLPGAVSPNFGQAEEWDLNGVIRRNANLHETEWKLRFNSALSVPGWNLTAREVAMIMANPRHEAVIDANVHLQPTPFDVTTIVQTLSSLRLLAAWAQQDALPAQLGAWRETDFKRYIADLRERGLQPGTIMSRIVGIKRLHEFGPALCLGGPRADPWKGVSARKAAKYIATGELSTPAIPPEIWFPLVRAAWIYVHTFAPDVLRASARISELRQQVRSFEWGGKDTHLKAWLADPANRIPVCHEHAAARPPVEGQRPDVNWSLLSLLAGFDPDGGTFNAHERPGAMRRARVFAALEAGHPTTPGVIDDLAQVTRPDGTVGPWHPGLDVRAVARLLPIVRNAAFCLVAALSMMRDSEIHEIRRGALVEHYSAPAIASTLEKGHAGRPTKHWWVTEPAAEAVIVAEAVSIHEERVFAPLRQGAAQTVDSAAMIDCFIAVVNEDRTFTGLAQIPAGRVRPHMFRKTMAMLTDQFPGSEIALGIQLKHVATRALANRSTLSYAAADVAWADELQSALDAGRFRRFKDLFSLHKAGRPIGYGPGAERVKEAFDEIAATVQARGGDSRIEDDLLRKARITIRFGMLNNCLFDASNPAGAVCLENAIVPPGHSGPLEERCRPDKCRNSMIGIEHVAIHDSHRRRQLVLLETPRLPETRKKVFRREIERVDAILAFVHEEHAAS